MEVYFTPPYTNGGIEKAHVNLVDFSKTAILDPGKSETVSFSIPKDDFAAYDSEGIKVNGGGYILEAGTYEVSIRANSHEIIDSETFTVNSDVAGRSSDLTPATNTFAYAKGNVTYLSRTDHFANYEEVTAAPPTDAYVMDDVTRAAVRANTPAGWDSTLYDNAGDQMPTTGADNGLTLYQLRGVAYDDPKWDRLLDQMSVEDMITLVNVGGFGTAEISSIGKVSTSDYDGPAGINLFFIGLTGTAYPSEVLMAQTWNKGLATKLGDAMAHEYTDVNTYGWYGPALNTHRSAFCGRNFEYYSEDSVLAGKFASAQINAVTELGVYPYMKHFALNDQETNRCTILLTYSNEQAMREIYMRPFEIVVKNFDFAAFKPLAVMSSLNWLGTQPACASSELLTTALRSEWGFKGMVITDFDGSYGYMITENCTRTGNDLKLGFGANPTCSVNNTSATQVLALRQSSKNILYTVANSGNYAGGDPYGGMDNMTKTFIKIDIAVVAVLLVIEVAVIVLCIKKRKAAK